MPRLLLVDDNQSIHRIVASLLASTAIEVSYASSAAEAFGYIAKEAPFDVVLLDTTLPEMDGWELLGRLRTNPKTAKMPVVMMAGVLEDLDAEKVERAPIRAILRKPVDFRDLAEKVGQFMFGPSMEAEPALHHNNAAPSDLLVLEEQDLAEEIDFSSSGEVSAKPSAESHGIDTVAVGNDVEEDEEVISLDIEDLDLDGMDRLAAAESGLSEDDSVDSFASDDVSGASGVPEEAHIVPTAASVAQTPLVQSLASEVKLATNIAPTQPTQSPSDYLDTSPEDFGPEIFAKETESRSFASPSYGLSSAASELLSDQRFIDAVARAVAKNMGMSGIVTK